MNRLAFLSFLRPTAQAALVLTVLAAGTPAHADPTVDQCVDSNTKAQAARRDGKFTAARKELRICVASSCPSLVRDDCAQRLDELERAQPTIVFQAQDASGHDVTAVRVTVDGQSLVDRLDGAAVAVDPGAHAFTFDAPGQTPVSEHLVLREGEKGRSERIVFGAGALPVVAATPTGGPEPANPIVNPVIPTVPVTPTTPESAPAPPGESASDPGRTQRIGALIVGGVGVAGIVVGTIYGANAASFWSNATAECSKSNCPDATRPDAQTNHDNASTAATAATVGFVAGGVLATAGIVLYFTAPSTTPEKQGRLSVAPTVAMGAAGATLRGTF